MSLEACADLVERADPLRFRCAMAASHEAQKKLLPLFAFNIEVSRAPWVTQEPMIAEMRLQWWRDAVEEIGQGGDVRSHEVTHSLRDVVRDASIEAEQLDQLITARRWDIYKDAFEDQAHFEKYIDRTAGNLMWASAVALGAEPDLEKPVRGFAFGAGVAAMLVAAAELQSRGRIPLIDGSHKGIVALAQNALARIERSKGIPRDIAPALWPGYQSEALLKQAIKEPARVADGALGLSEFAKNWGLLRRQMFKSY